MHMRDEHKNVLLKGKFGDGTCPSTTMPTLPMKTKSSLSTVICMDMCCNNVYSEEGSDCTCRPRLSEMLIKEQLTAFGSDHRAEDVANRQWQIGFQ